MTAPTGDAPFPCTACGLCCRLVHLSPQTAFLDRGDGTCRHFDVVTRLCTIYEDRPLICRVREYHQTHLRDAISWQAFVELNVQHCHDLQEHFGDDWVQQTVSTAENNSL